MENRYTDKEYEFIDKLLELSINGVSYTEMRDLHGLSYDLYQKLFSHISTDPYKLIVLSDKFRATSLGVDVSKIGFKKYLENESKGKQIDENIKLLTLADLEKTDKRSKKANIISIIAIVISTIVGLLQIANDSNNELKTKSDNMQTHSDIIPNLNHSKAVSNLVDSTNSKDTSNHK